MCIRDSFMTDQDHMRHFETHQSDHLKRKNGDAGDSCFLVHLWQQMWRFWQLSSFHIPPPQPHWASSHPSLLAELARPPSLMVDEQLSYSDLTHWDYFRFPFDSICISMIFIFRIFLNFSPYLLSWQRQIHLENTFKERSWWPLSKALRPLGDVDTY